MKKIVLILFLLGFSIVLYAQNVKASIEVHDVQVGKGNVYIAIYNSPESYKEQNAYKQLGIKATGSIVSIEEELPPGYYVISIYQDLNNNMKLDSNFLGIPKEPVGMSNYAHKGIPGGFDDLKVRISEKGQKIIIPIKKI